MTFGGTLLLTVALATYASAATTTFTFQTDVASVASTTNEGTTSEISTTLATTSAMTNSIANESTAASNNDSTTTDSTTFSSPATTPCSTTQWQVADENGTVCMLMSFNASIRVNLDGSNASAVIPNNNNISKSSCGRSSALFSVAFEADDMIWELSLYFVRDDENYVLYLTLLTLSNATDDIIIYRIEELLLEAPNGKYYACDIIDIDHDDISLAFIDPIMQPFAQLTDSNCGLGEAYTCHQQDGGNKTLAIVLGCTLSAAAVILAVVLTSCAINRKDSTYSTFSSVTS